VGMHLIAFSLLDPNDLLGVLKVAVGLGLVIFVHELGHFAVAKACGVKCEKFYLGFDIFGLKLAKFRWGETEYGIGALPLGGYVKMLGQEDNPAKVREEMERARLHKAEAAKSGDDKEVAASQAVEAEAQAALFDPRSYLAKSVPKRMAIISAGVVMNVIFAVVFAAAAYMHGVNEVPCVVGSLVPGFAAWRAGLQPGDTIVQIGDLKNPRFKDLQRRVTLGDNLEDGVLFKVVRKPLGQSSGGEPRDFVLIPDRDRTLAPMIGISGPSTTTLDNPPVAKTFVGEKTAAQFQPGDKVLKIDDTTVETGADVDRLLASHHGPIRLTILRKENEQPDAPTKEVTVELPARPMKTLGLVMEIGPIQSVQAGSPAAEAGLKAGDVLQKVDGEAVADPLFLPERLRRLAGKSVSLTVLRDGKPVEVRLTPREPLEVESVGRAGDVQTAPAIGIAYSVSGHIQDVLADGPAAKAGISKGKRVTQVEITPPKKARKWYQLFPSSDSETIEVSDEKPNWPYISALLQVLDPGTKATLTLDDGQSVTLEPQDAHDWFNPERGLHFEPAYTMKKADSLAQAVKFGATEAVESVTQVYRFLGKIGTQVSPKAAGGPIIIAEQAFHSANRGISDLLIFLTMLSANLAVINFLPIPLLDGGHMVFLIYEGIRGKPASERIVLAFHYAGFLFILSLMAFVFMLDLGIISRFGN
jgi:regulator of sigma E protease